MKNQYLINKFFEYYINRDFQNINQVINDDVVWYFNGDHKLSGIKNGLNEVIKFFDIMGEIMSKSKPNIEKLIVSEKDNYVIECQHIKTNREDDNNIDHHVTVLWTIENDKIKSGRHFFSDPQAVDNFFNSVS
ncbi:MAG: nuclear transport factor 2 family protein [Candidatus Sericytochromatia bacterium]